MAGDTLYIIGNGFDLAHGIATKYSDFKIWLFVNGHANVILELQSAFPSQEKNGNYLLWSDFEKALGLFDFDKVINWGFEDLLITAECSIDGQILRFPQKCINTQLPDIVSEAFAQWVRSIPINHAPITYNLKKDAYYLTFNYTDTLEKLYTIQDRQILHIHGRASSGNMLIVGHNREINLSNYWNNNLSMRENNERTQKLADINEMRKPCADIIEQNNLFFQRLTNVNEVYIKGHSCSEIDYPYLQKVKSIVSSKAVWHFAPFSEEDTQRMQKLTKALNINNKQIIGL